MMRFFNKQTSAGVGERRNLAQRSASVQNMWAFRESQTYQIFTVTLLSGFFQSEHHVSSLVRWSCYHKVYRTGKPSKSASGSTTQIDTVAPNVPANACHRDLPLRDGTGDQHSAVKHQWKLSLLG